MHTYQKRGIYNVCLTASNKNGSSTYCKTQECTTTATEAIAGLLDLKIYPNPASKFFILESKEPYYSEAQIRISTINGEVLQKSKINLSSGFISIDFGSLVRGMYFIEVKGREGILYRGKLVLVEQVFLVNQSISQFVSWQKTSVKGMAGMTGIVEFNFQITKWRFLGKIIKIIENHYLR